MWITKKLVLTALYITLPAFCLAQGGLARGAAKEFGKRMAPSVVGQNVEKAASLGVKRGVQSAVRPEGSYLLTEYGQKYLERKAFEVNLKNFYTMPEDQFVWEDLNAYAEGPSEMGANFKEIYKAKNERYAALFKLLQTANYHKFQKLYPVLKKSVREEVMLKNWLDFTWYIPEDRNLIFIQENSIFDLTSFSVDRLLTNYKKKYPNRKIYLAVEEIFNEHLDSVFVFFDGEKAFTSFQHPDYQTFVEETWRKGIAVTGLDYLSVLEKRARRIAAPPYNSDGLERYRYKNSFYGVEEQNKAWAVQLRALREKAGPDALIVVVGIGYNFEPQMPFNLPDLMKEEKTFYIDLTSLTAGTQTARWKTAMWNNLDVAPAVLEEAGQTMIESGQEVWIIRYTENREHGKILGADMVLEAPTLIEVFD